MELIYKRNIMYKREVGTMIRRDMYMEKISPFIGTDLVKVMTGIRRCGKSVMLELIQEELKERGISEDNFI